MPRGPHETPPPHRPGDRAGHQAALRRRAEQMLASREPNASPPASEELYDLLHELQVHQIELEMQNEELRAARAELEASRDRYADLYDFAPLGYLTLDEHGLVTEANLTAATMIGVERGRLIGRRLITLAAGRGHGELGRFWHRCRQAEQGRPVECHASLSAPGGRAVPVELRATPLRRPVTGQRVYRATFVDVSQLRRSEEALRESEGRLRLALESGRMGTWDWCVRTGESVFNDLEYALLGLSPAVGPIDCEGFLAFVHPDDQPHVRRVLAETLEHGDTLDLEFRIVRADGAVRWLASAARLERDAEGRPLRMTGVNYDITERKQTEEALRRLNDTLEERVAQRTALAERRAAHLRRLAADLTHAEHGERRQLAQVLHDGLQQLLVACKLRAAGLQAGGQENLPENVQRIRALLDECIDATRDLTMELSPPVLQEGSLTQVFEWLARWFGEKHDLAVNVGGERELPPATEPVRVFLFQAVRELLFNAVKHSGAAEARITLARHGEGGLAISVEDRGKGFDPRVLERRGERAGGFGLFSIRERIGVLGGWMEMHGAPGEGARFRLILPAGPAQE